MLPPNARTVRTSDVVEPLTLAEAKLYLRVGGGAEDDLIRSLITAARLKCAQLVDGPAVAPAAYLTTADYSPWGGCGGYWTPWLATCGDWRQAATIELPQGPLVAVQSIAWVDAAGTARTLDPVGYRVITGSPGLVEPSPGSYLPIIPFGATAIQVAYTAGLLTEHLEAVRTAMRLLCSHLHTYRSADAPIPTAIEYILAPLRNYRYA